VPRGPGAGPRRLPGRRPAVGSRRPIHCLRLPFITVPGCFARPPLALAVSPFATPAKHLEEPRMTDRHERLRTLAATQWRIAVTLTAATVAIYFGFILLVAYQGPLLGRLIVPGLSVGILLGALVIVASWLLTWIYVWWANTHYDEELRRLRE
jgi:uncharacterized membrane protein (DUF485 family)